MLGVVVVISGIGLVAIAGIVALVRFVAKGTEGNAAREIALAAAFVVAVLVADALGSYLSIYYVKPLGWVLVVAVCVAVVIALFVALGRSVRWQPLRVVALLGLALASMVLFFALGMGLSGVIKPPFPYTTRARQIADANGFSVLMPPGEQLQTDSLPIEPLPAPDAGVWLDYEHFSLEERKAGTGSAKGTLEDRLRATPTEKATEVTMTTATVQGVPAVLAEYRIAPPEGSKDPAFAPKFQRETKLIFELGGVDVRLRSFSFERESGGNFVPFPSLTTSDLAAIAETLRPPPQ